MCKNSRGRKGISREREAQLFTAAACITRDFPDSALQGAVPPFQIAFPLLILLCYVPAIPAAAVV